MSAPQRLGIHPPIVEPSTIPTQTVCFMDEVYDVKIKKPYTPMGWYGFLLVT